MGTVACSRTWQMWGLLMVALYLATAWATWERTLIGTEVWALYYAGKPLAEHIDAVRQDLVHPPLMYIVHRAWMTIFGDGDNAAKALPLVINAPALLLFVFVATRATQHWRAASLLFCTAYMAGRVPATARMYGLGLLLATAAILLWDRWRERPSAKHLIRWMVVMVLLVYTHFFGLLLLGGFVAIGFLAGQRRRAFLAAAAAVAIAWIPWLLYVLPVYQERGVETNLWWVRMFLGDPVRALAQVPVALMGEIPAGSWNRVIVGAAFSVNVALLGAAVGRVGWKLWRATAGAAAWVWTMLLLTSIPVLSMFAFSVLRTPALHIRFLLGVVPSYWLFVGALAELGGRLGRLLLYGIVLPWSVLSGALAFNEALRAAPLRVAAEELARAERPGDIILCAGECNSFYWEWTRRLRRSAPVVFIRTERDVGRLPLERRRRIEQDERLSVLPELPLHELQLAGATGVWVVTSSYATSSVLAESLLARGYRQEMGSRHGFASLARFERAK